MTCQLTVMDLATTGSCRSDVKGDVELSVLGVGAGEGLAAVCGHQFEGEWGVASSKCRDKRGHSREKRRECRFPERPRQARSLPLPRAWGKRKIGARGACALPFGGLKDEV